MKPTLFRSISNEEFLRVHYGQKPCFDQFAEFGQLICKEFVNIQETFEAFSYKIIDDLFLFKNGIACKRNVYCDENNSKIFWEKVWQMHVQEGVTVYMRGLQKYLPRISELLNEIQKVVPDRLPFANIFLTPQQSVGLKPHFDPTEFIVLQLSGSKEWKTWIAPETATAESLLPQEMAVYCQSVVATTAPTATYKLVAGDALYVPLYMIHAPTTGETSSCHITIGLADLSSKRLQN